MGAWSSIGKLVQEYNDDTLTRTTEDLDTLLVFVRNTLSMDEMRLKFLSDLGWSVLCCSLCISRCVLSVITRESCGCSRTHPDHHLTTTR